MGYNQLGDTYANQETLATVYESQGSMMLQFENKAEDLFCIADTPEKAVNIMLSKKFETNTPKIKSKLGEKTGDSTSSMFKEEDFELLKDDFDFESGKASFFSNNKPTKNEKTSLDEPVKKFDDQQQFKSPKQNEIESFGLKEKSHNPMHDHKVERKKEPKTQLKSSVETNQDEITVVYSKFRPPPESIKLKHENQPFVLK